MTPQTKTSGLAIASLVVSILFCIPLAPIVGIVLGIIALSQINKSQGQLTGRGLAIAGICVGGLAIFANIGMLAAIAIPNFIRYEMRSKQSEARASLMAISSGASLYFSERNKLPEGNTDWQPPHCDSGKPCEPAPAAWTAPPWSDLNFEPHAGHRYQYRYSSTGTTFTAEAQADLDGDGEASLFQITGAVGPDGALDVRPVQNMNEGKF